MQTIKSHIRNLLAPNSSISTPEGAKNAIFAAGCFWGVENAFRKQFLGKGIHDTRVGYTGGNTQDPKYRAVCSGSTGHAEAVLMTYDPNQVKYSQLVEFFYKIHNPTTLNQQGADIGTQYRSAIFYYDEDQEKTARDVTEKVEKWWWHGIKTVILPAGEWWDAEDYHQKYLIKNPNGYQCSTVHVQTRLPLDEYEKK